MSSIALRGLKAHCDTTIDLARKLLVNSDNCLLSALETYEVQIDSLLSDVEAFITKDRLEKMTAITASRDRQKKLRTEISRLEKYVSDMKADDVVGRIDELLEEDDRSSTIEEMKATIRRQLDELNSV